ncbi:MAG: hypothetical protein AAGF44_06580, partial [Pseudomonadota bacterium]
TSLHDRAQPLAGQVVGLSVSDSPDSLSLGFLKSHVDQAMGSIAVHLASSGARVGYGGNLDPEGFTFKILNDVAERYAREAISTARPPFIHYLAQPVWRRWVGADLCRHVARLGGAGEVVLVRGDGAALGLVEEKPADPEGRNTQIRAAPRLPMHDGQKTLPPLPALWSAWNDLCRIEAELAQPWQTRESLRPPVTIQGSEEAEEVLKRWRGDEVCAATSFSNMRRFMAFDETARVVTGGKISGYSGHLPGILEEATLGLATGSPVLPLPIFGGAAAATFRALTGDMTEFDGLDTKACEMLQTIVEIHPMYLEGLEAAGGAEVLHRLSTPRAPQRLGVEILSLLSKLASSAPHT